MTGQAELVTVATLAATTSIILATAMHTWGRADRRRNAAPTAGAVTGRDDHDTGTHSHTDEGDPDA